MKKYTVACDGKNGWVDCANNAKWDLYFDTCDPTYFNDSSLAQSWCDDAINYAKEHDFMPDFINSIHIEEVEENEEDDEL